MQSNRCLFRLVLSAHHTEEIESSSLPTMLLKTPCAMDCDADKRASKGVSGTSGTLAQEIASGYVAKRGWMLPTPNACDYNTTWSEEAKQECLKRRAEEGKEAYPSKFNSLRQLARENLLPTPVAKDWKNGCQPDSERIQRKKKQGWTIELNDLATMGKLPGCSLENDGQPFRLSPLFTEEMMGFPLMWTSWPFLSQNGEPSH